MVHSHTVFINIFVICAAIPKATAFSCPQYYIWTDFFCAAEKAFLDTGYTYTQATEICNRTGGVLPAFASHSEADAIWQYLSGGERLEPFYIGSWNYQPHSAAIPGIWHGSDGSCPYVKWGRGEPNNDGGAASCAQMYLDANNYYMRDVPCTSITTSIVCIIRPTALGVCAEPPPTTVESITSPEPDISNIGYEQPIHNYRKRVSGGTTSTIVVSKNNLLLSAIAVLLAIVS